MWCLRYVPLRTVLCQNSRIPFHRRPFSDKISDAYSHARRRPAPSKEQNPYMTRAKYEEQMRSQRARSVGAERGVMPTRWQKFCLVLTRMYRKPSDIPEYVGNGTMNRMHDRMRVVFICIGVVCFFVLAFYFESQTASKIARDRDSMASRSRIDVDGRSNRLGSNIATFVCDLFASVTKTLVSVRMSLSLKRLPSCILLSRYSRTCLSFRGISDRISNAYNNTLQRQGQALKEGGGAYMTKSRFLEEMQHQRVQDVGAEYGEMPNKWQKFCLVLTRMYHSQSEIPQYVRSGTMNRMHDRMRIVFIAVAVACFYVFFFYIEHSTASKISKDRDDAMTNEKSQ
ncbi:unnamed protein product [Cylicocyclus nassatus]|uniref:Transmembrane protein n=1 Tax=Cylicocyclus nassatus TaxID=53992 RepID=A0AA36HC61_CYLNA|nr:unnamed protein product [Cylicocyclus nassatus]